MTLVQLPDGISHFGIVTGLAGGFGEEIEAACIGVRLCHLQRFEVAQSGGGIACQKIHRANPHSCLVALRLRQAGRQRGVFRAGLVEFLRVQPFLAALQLLKRRGRREVAVQRSAQTFHGSPGLRRQIRVGRSIIDLLVRESGLELFPQRLIGHREEKIAIRLGQQSVIGLEDFEGCGVGNSPALDKQGARSKQSQLAGQRGRRGGLRPVGLQIPNGTVNIAGLQFGRRQVISDVILQFGKLGGEAAELLGDGREVVGVIRVDALAQPKGRTIGREQHRGCSQGEPESAAGGHRIIASNIITLSITASNHGPRVIFSQQAVIIMSQAAQNFKVQIIHHSGRL